MSNTIGASAAKSESVPFPSQASWDRVNMLIEEYHRELCDRERVPDDVGAAFRAHMDEADATFGGRLLCPYLRPNFMAQSQFDYVRYAIREVMSAISVVEARAFEDPGFFARMGLTEAEERLVRLPSSTRRVSVKSRMDTFLTPDSLCFVEYNAESPAGIAYADTLQDQFLRLPIMRRFVERYGLGRLQGRQYVLDTLLDAWRENGRTGRPSIAIVDYPSVPTYTEFEMFRDFFTTAGYETTIADPRSLEMINGRLVAPGGFKIDILYRRVLVNELLEQIDRCEPMVKAVEQGAVVMVNSFRCKLLHKKMLFAMLWEPDMQQYYTVPQKTAIRRHVPWTTRVANKTVDFEGARVDLMELALREQHRMVCKPNDEYGGKGVTIGWERTQSEWDQTLRHALEAPHILQERVPTSRLDFPDLERNIAPRVVDLDPFIFGDEVHGFLTRLSDTSLCNVTSGGGQVPTFLLPDL